MKHIIFIGILFNALFVNAQSVGTISLHDSLPQSQKISFTKSSSNIIHNKNNLLKPYIIPIGLITYGVVALENDGLKNFDHQTQQKIQEKHSTFQTRIDNYLQYSPAIAVYGLNAFGIKGKNNLVDRTFIYGLSTFISSVFVLSLKKITKVQRPDNSGFNSFPSGHTTTAFAAAEFLRTEYKEISPLYGIAGYAAATATGVLRLYNNKHWVSDVVAGAGFGILSTKLAYLIYPTIKRKIFKSKKIDKCICNTLLPEW